MVKLYDYTNDKRVVLGAFDNWLDAEKALDSMTPTLFTRDPIIVEAL